MPQSFRSPPSINVRTCFLKRFFGAKHIDVSPQWIDGTWTELGCIFSAAVRAVKKKNWLNSLHYMYLYVLIIFIMISKTNPHWYGEKNRPLQTGGLAMLGISKFSPRRFRLPRKQTCSIIWAMPCSSGSWHWRPVIPLASSGWLRHIPQWPSPHQCCQRAAQCAPDQLQGSGRSMMHVTHANTSHIYIYTHKHYINVIYIYIHASHIHLIYTSYIPHIYLTHTVPHKYAC